MTSPVDAVANLRRSVIVSSVLGLISLVVAALMGHPLMGMFGCVGLALGAMNNRMLQRSVLSYAENETIRKGQFSRKVFARLGLITLIAFGCALLIRPDGLGVFVGLAVFQVLMLVGATVPVFRSMRHS
jgi:cation transport ATPase